MQDANSPVIEEFLFFHDFVTILLVIIVIFVGYLIITTFWNKNVNINLAERQILECIWTVTPSIILVQIAVPSLILLYIIDETVSMRFSIKVVGHQWYWRYEYSDFWNEEVFFWENKRTSVSKILNFESYMLPQDSLSKSDFRCLDVDNRTVIPFSTNVRLLISSADVLHSWTVPVLGVKADASPGRLNQVKFIAHRPGLYFGQCSEICGVNHRFIPIAVEIIRIDDFVLWWTLNIFED